MEAQKVEEMAKKRLEKKELEDAAKEKETLEKIPQFASYFWLGGKIREGQTAKGFMSMSDCQLFLGSMQSLYDMLKNVVEHPDNPTAEENFSFTEPTLADGVTFHAYHVLKTVMENLTGTGFLSIEDSADAIGHLERIRLTIVEHIDPEFKKEQIEANLQEKKEELKTQRSGKNKGKKNNKKR